ncbi:MAG: DUF6049 family protein [Actinomycetota bacterium]|nr:DUF6049 family protein [Actinomycetota bacterium]
MPTSPVAARRAPLHEVVVGALVLVLALLLGWAPAETASGAGAGAGTRSVRATLAQEESVPVQVLLEQVSPAVASPGAALAVRGSIRNVGRVPVPTYAVRVDTAYRGLDTRGALTSWASGELDLATTRMLGLDEIGVDLAPGAEVDFQVQVAAGTVAPPFDFATLPMSIEVLGETSDRPVRGRLRTFLPWDGETQYRHTPIPVAWLVPVTLPPDPELASLDDDVRRQAWLRATGPDSAARALVDELRNSPVTFLVDPALLAPLQPVATLVVPEPTGEEPVEEEPPAEPPDEQPGTPTTDPPTTDPPTTGVPGAPTSEGPSPTSPTAPDRGTAPDTATPTATGPGQDQEPNGGAVPEQPPTGGDDPADDDPADDEPADDDTDPREGQDVPTEPDDPAADLRGALADLDPDRLWWLPVGDTDTAALTDLGVATEVIAGLVAGQLPAPAADGEPDPAVEAEPAPSAAELLATGRRDVAWPALASVTDDQLAVHRAVWEGAEEQTGALSAMVVPSASVEELDGLTTPAARRHPDGPVLLGYDEVLSGIAINAGTPATDGAAEQRLLAETLAVYQERPADRRTLLLTTPRGTSVDPDTLRVLSTSLRQAPWLRPTSGEELLRAGMAQAQSAALAGTPPRVTAPGDPTAYPLPEQTPLTRTRIEQVEEARDRLVGAAQIVPGGDLRARSWDPVLDQQFSTRWREGPASWPAATTDARSVASEVTSGISVNPTTVNFLADEGLIQITVSNDLPVPVTDLRMTVTPGNGRLRVVEQPEPITIGAGSRATVQFRARAVAAGQVPLDTALTTPNGTQVSGAESMQIRVRPTGAWIYWVLGGVAGVILVLGLVRAVRPPRAGTTDPATSRSGERE